MSSIWLNNGELIDLLIKGSTEGLSAEESAELERLTSELSHEERIAATAMLTSLGPLQRMPDTTRRRALKVVDDARAASKRAALGEADAFSVVSRRGRRQPPAECVTRRFACEVQRERFHSLELLQRGAEIPAFDATRERAVVTDDVHRIRNVAADAMRCGRSRLNAPSRSR